MLHSQVITKLNNAIADVSGAADRVNQARRALEQAKNVLEAMPATYSEVVAEINAMDPSEPDVQVLVANMGKALTDRGTLLAVVTDRLSDFPIL